MFFSIVTFLLVTISDSGFSGNFGFFGASGTVSSIGFFGASGTVSSVGFFGAFGTVSSVGFSGLSFGFGASGKVGFLLSSVSFIFGVDS